ncbi:hypothetical protein AB0M39_34560 [Streptomyces sp. NPDC051907]|uniref:hypothetical protein n=1 Tax=Streptomyces sp. NPDC051907 TaxID=3155284 RepID=UPI00342D73D5
MNSLMSVGIHGSPQQSANPYVLAGRPLRQGSRLEDTARFSDDVWRLAPAIVQVQERTVVLNFPTIPARFRLATKRLFYALLCPELESPPGEDRPAIASVRSAFGELKRLLTWLDSRWPADRVELSAISPADLDRYNRHLLTLFPHRDGAREAARAAVRLLWRWRLHLGNDQLRFDPLHLDGWGEERTHRGRENGTGRLPEDVLGPLLVWALRFIDDFAPDILEADRKWHERRAVGTGRVTSHRVDERLQQLLGDHIEARRPLPGHQGKINISQLAATLRCHRREITKRREAIDAVAAVVGVADAAFVDEGIQGVLDGRPWIKAVTVDHTLPTSLAALARHLQSACYIVIAFLSGMRDSEVKHIKRACVEAKRDEDGNAYRWRVHSRAFKGEEDAEGVDATWTVCEPVVRAIRVLEQLQPAGQNYLMSALLHGPGQPKKAGVDRAVGVGATNQNLNLFAGFVNELCTERGRTDTIAAGQGHALRLKTRVFRRTLAWFIARHPGGVIAGALQYRHQSIQMFEGYAGTSDSGFRAEVESEQAIARGEVYMEMIDSHQHAGLAGPAAEEAARRLADFGERAQFHGQVALDRHRLKRTMKRHDPAIYPGEYITCVNDPAKALCEKARRGNSEGLPSHGGCLPLACRNVTLTPENIAAWQGEIVRIDGRIASRPMLPPRLRRFLESRRAEIVEFLTANRQQAVPA